MLPQGMPTPAGWQLLHSLGDGSTFLYQTTKIPNLQIMSEEHTKTPNHELSALGCPMHAADVDLFSEGAAEHWYEAYDILHDESPVHCIPGEGFEPGTDAFILTKHEDIAAVVRDQDRFPLPGAMLVQQMAASGDDPFAGDNVSVLFASMTTLRPNPEMWRTHRQELTDPWVGPGAGRNQAMIQAVTNELIDSWIDVGEVDFVAQFAQPLPQMTMAHVLGWPIEDLKLLKKFGDGCVKPFVYGKGHRNVLTEEETASQFVVLNEFREYTNNLIEQRAWTHHFSGFIRRSMIISTQINSHPLRTKKLLENLLLIVDQCLSDGGKMCRKLFIIILLS